MKTETGEKLREVGKIKNVWETSESLDGQGLW